MAQIEILGKLENLLSRHENFSEESCVVYLLVEIRKVIDLTQSEEKYPLLKFYADWTVHSEKDRITPEIKKIAEKIYDYAARKINTPVSDISDNKSEALDFAYMRALGKEMTAFFREFNLSSNLPIDNEKWIDFISTLVKVLENQPIINPIENIEKIFFAPSIPRSVILIIFFKIPINGKSEFRLMNTY